MGEPSSGVSRMPPQLVMLLMMYLMRSKEVRHLAIDRLEPADFYWPEERDFRLLWGVMVDFHKQGTPQFVAREYLLAEVYRCTAGHSEYQSPEAVQSALRLVSSTYALSDEFDAGYGLRLLQQLLDERKVLDPLRRSLYGDSVQANNVTENLQRAFTKSRVTKASILNPMMAGKELFGAVSRKSCGVQFIDTMLEGGFMEAAVYGLLAPSSGGKTSLSIQMLTAYGMERRHAVMASYESSVRGEMQNRICACATGIDVKHFEGNMFENLRPDVQQVLRAKQQICGEYIHVLDMSGRTNDGRVVGVGGPDELESIVDDLTKAGKKPELLIVDWLWPMLLRWLSTKGKSTEKARDYVTEVVDRFCMMASKYDMNVWINHQVSAVDAKKKSGSLLHYTAAAEAKNFPWLLSACFAMSAVDIRQARKHPIITITVSKSRSQKQSYRFIELHGELSTFVDVSENVTIDERTDEIIDKGTDNDVINFDENPATAETKTTVEVDHTGGGDKV